MKSWLTPAKAALYASCAEAMYWPGQLAPQIDRRIDGEVNIVEYITAKDALFGTQHLGMGERVYYGFLAQSKTDPMQFVVAIRGTESLGEWIEDAEAFVINHVHAGFASIASSMECGIPARPVAEAISARVPLGARVDVVGHSLGAPLAADVTLGLRAMNIEATGLFFAMPRPGDAVFAAMFDTAVGADNYMVWNYLRDRVPQCPIWLPLHRFVRLNNQIVIRPKDSTAVIPDDVVSNHRCDSYAELLAHLISQGSTP